MGVIVKNFDAWLCQSEQIKPIKVETHPDAERDGEILNFYGYTAYLTLQSPIFTVTLASQEDPNEPRFALLADDGSKIELFFAENFMDFLYVLGKFNLLGNYKELTYVG